MKIRLSELRKIIRETVEQEMGSEPITPITAADYELLQQLGFGPTLGRMRGAIEDRVVSGRPVTVGDLQTHIDDFELVTKPNVKRRKGELADPVAHIKGNQVAAYLIDKETTRYKNATGPSHEIGRHTPKPLPGGGFYSGD